MQNRLLSVRLKINNHVIIWIKSCDTDWYISYILVVFVQKRTNCSKQQYIGTCSSALQTILYYVCMPLDILSPHECGLCTHHY